MKKVERDRERQRQREERVFFNIEILSKVGGNRDKQVVVNSPQILFVPINLFAVKSKLLYFIDWL